MSNIFQNIINNITTFFTNLGENIMKFFQRNYGALGFNVNGGGTGAPISSLTVNGQTDIRGTIRLNAMYWPSNDGTANQVLVTDGWGHLSWFTPLITGGPVSVSNLSASGTVTLDGLTYPSTDGSANQVLMTNGSGSLVWGNANSIRNTVNISTGSLANNDTFNGAATGYKSYGLLSITTSAAAWVRIYSNDAARTNDASRTQGTDPTPNSGVIAEFITSGSTTLPATPMILGFNNESTPTTDMPMAITNLSGSSTNITVTMSLLKLES